MPKVHKDTHKTEKSTGKKAGKSAKKTAGTKKAVKAVKKETTVQKDAASSIVQTKDPVPGKQEKLQADVFSPKGIKIGTMLLPEAIFAAKVNKQLMAQAVRVYLANQREGSASTKTRGEVQGSTRKIYKQKGTGRARHGSIRAPIFVKGGKALGPKPRDYRLNLPRKMRKKAVVSAFSVKRMDNAIKIVNDMNTLELKTKVFHALFSSLAANRKTLVLLGKTEKQSARAMRNLPYVDVLNATDVHTYALLYHRHIILTKEAVSELEQVFV
jgi:large subunit ribosomal protein L4